MFDAACADDERWRAVERRDRAADGRFYCCVKTTGVYCLPSCAGRPQRRNVFFVWTRAEAESAGMRPCKRCRPDRFVQGPLAGRIEAIDWGKAVAALDSDGFAPLGRLLTDAECASLASIYEDPAVEFRSRVVMARHGFGAGEYKYFADPLPEIVAALRERLYGRLAGLASEWRIVLGGQPFPGTLREYREVCAAAGQSQPTPLLLRYGPGDYNRLHQDIYGFEMFPIQVAILLSAPGKDFEGGEFVLAEQRPRMQSRPFVVPLEKGDAVAFAVNERPVTGPRGRYRTRMRHGVSTIRSGRRMTLGVIFHDAPGPPLPEALSSL